MGFIGIAPEADIHLGHITPSGLALSWNNAAAQIIDMAQPATKVVSISFSSKETYEPPTMLALHDAIANAYHQRGILIVASTGNEGSATIKAYLAQWSEVIGVGGSGMNDEYVYNNYARGNVEIAALAVDVGVVCNGGATLGHASGTSFATPIVAAAAMLLREVLPGISNDSLRARLRGTAIPMANTQKSGAGRINIGSAVSPPFQPGPAFTVLIQPPFNPVRPYSACQFYAATTNGFPATYEWVANGLPVGDGTAYYRHPAGATNFQLAVTVTSVSGSVAMHQLAMSVDAGAPVCYDQ